MTLFYNIGHSLYRPHQRHRFIYPVSSGHKVPPRTSCCIRTRNKAICPCQGPEILQEAPSGAAVMMFIVSRLCFRTVWFGEGGGMV